MTAFSRDRPTEWRPEQVRNLAGMLGGNFTDASAWEFIVAKLESGHPEEILQLHQSAGAKGHVMKIDMEPGTPQLYIKLQLGSGKIIGRSFHYSNRQVEPER